MKPLTAAELLAVWEHGLNQPLLERVLFLLEAACPEMDHRAVAQLSIGRRDTMLMQLRECMFGQRLVNTARCPQCAERVEWENRIPDLTMPADPDLDNLEAFCLKVADFELQFRLPNSSDIAAAVETPDDKTARNGLIKRCIKEARHLGESCDIGQLPATVLDALSRRMEELDPQAEIRIELTCPKCAHQWPILFDIASFLWAEIHQWAEYMIRTIHNLASKYGWSEKQILELSPVRRQLYAGLVNP